MKQIGRRVPRSGDWCVARLARVRYAIGAHLSSEASKVAYAKTKQENKTKPKDEDCQKISTGGEPEKDVRAKIPGPLMVRSGG